MCDLSWYTNFSLLISYLTHHSSECMGHNTLENCRQGTRRRHSLSLVAQEPRLVQHGITSDPTICVCGEASCHAWTTPHWTPWVSWGILLPPSSQVLAAVSSRQPAQHPGPSDYRSGILKPSVGERDPSRAGLSSGQGGSSVSVFHHILFLDLLETVPLVHRWIFFMSVWILASFAGMGIFFWGSTFRELLIMRPTSAQLSVTDTRPHRVSHGV